MDNRNNKEEIFFNFTYYALKLLGKNLYTNPWVAISELVANGLDAGAPEVYITIDLQNKKDATIEIFDCGSGMGYEDLCDKYAIIGRNKREDIANVNKEKMLGRKGIGKLAALYLSPTYYLATKTANESSCWVVDSTKFSDNDIPKLDKVASYDNFLSGDKWNNFTTGTMIKLLKVNLEHIGEEKINSLKSILADFYLLNKINSKIFIATLDKKNRVPDYEEISKTIFFDTMYAIFDNTDEGYANLLSDKIYLTEDNVPKEIDYPRATRRLISINKNDTEGFLEVKDDKGNIKEVKYELKGWIGIQGSLKDVTQRRNNPNYKKALYRGNSLRLYVRNKLAVDNLMNYVKSSQAFANYVEGEISFDVLDSDELEDISTSNREGYPITDERVKKLIEIVKKIITALFGLRARIGNEINKQIYDYEKRIRAEEKAKKEAAEKAKREAEEKANEEEKKRRLAEEEAKSARSEMEKTKAQNRVIFSAINEDQISFASKLHLVKTNAIVIKGAVKELIDKIDYHPYPEIPSIAMSADRILSAIKYSAIAHFNIEDEFLTENIVEYIKQYIENVIAIQYPYIQFKCDLNCLVIKKFKPQDISLVIDNIISNSIKANAKYINICDQDEQDFVRFEFKDNGNGLDTNVNTDELFEFGHSETFGTGIGLYNIRAIVRELGGDATIKANNPKGAIIEVRINK